MPEKKKTMKVLITGATGLVGNELVSLLLKNGVDIHYLTTSESKVREERKYKGFYWDPDKGIIDEACLDEVDAVIHLAGASIAKRWTPSYKQEILESRVNSTNLLYNLLKNKPNRVHQFISASAIGIYPDSLNKVYSEESTEVDDSFFRPCSRKIGARSRPDIKAQYEGGKNKDRAGAVRQRRHA